MSVVFNPDKRGPCIDEDDLTPRMKTRFCGRCSKMRWLPMARAWETKVPFRRHFMVRPKWRYTEGLNDVQLRSFHLPSHEWVYGHENKFILKLFTHDARHRKQLVDWVAHEQQFFNCISFTIPPYGVKPICMSFLYLPSQITQVTAKDAFLNRSVYFSVVISLGVPSSLGEDASKIQPGSRNRSMQQLANLPVSPG